MATFSPTPGQILHVLDDEFAVEPHPSVPSIAYGQEGGRGTIYKVRDRRRQAYALKVMKRKARSADQVAITNRLRPYSGIRGLRAAHRRVVPSDERALSLGLAGSLLMPWIEGRTWFDVLQRARKSGESVERTTAVQLCRAFLDVVSELEQRGAAHTDVASGNVVVDMSARTVELIDLEELFDAAGAADGLLIQTRTPGYSRRYGASTLWNAEGDRFASAVLAAEMLMLSRRELARLSNGESFFDPEAVEARDTSRYESAFHFLQHEFPHFWAAFDRSWRANSLGECARISELRESVERTAPTPPVELRHAQPASHVSEEAAVPGAGGFTWRPLDGAAAAKNNPPKAGGSVIPPAADVESGAPSNVWQPGQSKGHQATRGTLVTLAVVLTVVTLYSVRSVNEAKQAREREAAAEAEVVRLQEEKDKQAREEREQEAQREAEQRRAQEELEALRAEAQRRAQAEQEAAIKANQVVSVAPTTGVATELGAAIWNADQNEIRAYHYLRVDGLDSYASGSYLANVKSRVQALNAENHFEIGILEKQNFESALVSRDGTRGDVQLTEVWSSYTYDRNSGQCLSLTRSTVPQLVHLKLGAKGWTVDKIDMGRTTSLGPYTCR